MGASTVWIACMQNDLDSLQDLFSQGADISKKDFNNRSPLWIACYKGYIRIVKFLLENGADLEGGDVVRWMIYVILYYVVVMYHILLIYIYMYYSGKRDHHYSWQQRKEILI